MSSQFREREDGVGYAGGRVIRQLPRQAVYLLRRQTVSLGHLAERALGLETLVGRDHGDAGRTVGVVHVLNHPVARPPADIQIDVRTVGPFEVQEPFEQQAVLQGVHARQAQAPRHETSRRRTACHARDTLPARPRHDFVHDEKVVGKAEAVDDREFLLQPPHGCGPKRAVARLESCEGELREARVWRLAFRDRGARKDRPPEREVEVAIGRDADGVRHGLRPAAEQGGHFLGAFQVRLRMGEFPAVYVGDGRERGDGAERAMGAEPAGRVKGHGPARDQRDAPPCRRAGETVAKEARRTVAELLEHRKEPALGQSAREAREQRRVGDEDVDPLVVGGDGLGEVELRVQVPGGHQAAEGAVAVEVVGQQDGPAGPAEPAEPDAGASGHVREVVRSPHGACARRICRPAAHRRAFDKFHAQDRLQPRLAGLPVERDRPVQAVAVGEGQIVVPQGAGGLYKFLDPAGAVQVRMFAPDVEVDEAGCGSFGGHGNHLSWPRADCSLALAAGAVHGCAYWLARRAILPAARRVGLGRGGQDCPPRNPLARSNVTCSSLCFIATGTPCAGGSRGRRAGASGGVQSRGR